MFRKTYAEINSETLESNVRQICGYYPDFKYYFGVVKGNAYGHGMQSVKALAAGGINYFATATLEEAIRIREYEYDIPILCLEPVAPEFSLTSFENGVTLTVHRHDYLEQLLEIAPAGTKVHIKLDTGMNRLGFKNPDEVKKCVELIEKSGNITLEGIYTHLATSGLNDLHYDEQLAEFKRLTGKIDLSAVPIVHIDRSLTLVHHKKPDFVNGTRLGICMYGFAQSIPSPTGLHALKRKLLLHGQMPDEPVFENSLKLKTAMSLYSEIIDVKKVKKGEFVGYGAKFTADRDITAATAAIGYYDGVPANAKAVYVNNTSCRIIGEVCMDMIQLEVPDNTKIGDRVEIFGNNIPISASAHRSGTNAYRLLTGISSRVPRIYDGKEYYL